MQPRGEVAVVGNAYICDLFERLELAGILGLHLTVAEALDYLAARCAASSLTGV